MELKRIIARDSRSANEKAIQMYGRDVLIISSNKVDNQIELVVAVETAPDLASTAAAPMFKPLAVSAEALVASQPTSASGAFANVLEGHMANPAKASTAESGSEIDMVMDALTALSRRVVSAPVESELAVSKQLTSPLEQAPAGAVNMPATPAQAAPAEVLYDFRRSQETVELLRQEMSSLRQEFALSRQMAVWQGGLGLTPEIEQWWNQLLELGMPARLRSLLLDSVRSLGSVDEARGKVFQLLSEALKRPALTVPAQGVHALCGPSGAGKTLMVVRLAKQASLQFAAEQQAIISYCDQRPGSWSQLQVLAAQTGIECYKANDAHTLQLLLEELSGRKAIWVDTPGNDFLNHAQTLRSVAQSVQLHAVLPVDATVTSVQKVLETSDLTWASLMLSKQDEAAHPWPLIQGLCNHPIGVSMVGQGASLSLAAATFDPARLVQMALSPLGEESRGMPSVSTVAQAPARP